MYNVSKIKIDVNYLKREKTRLEKSNIDFPTYEISEKFLITAVTLQASALQ